MKTVLLIGVGAGDPEHLTLQAIKALNRIDVLFVTDKRPETSDLTLARKQICARYIKDKPYRIVEIADPERDRQSASYQSAVEEWHDKRCALYERLLREQLADGECGAFLAWGDPALYDSTLRIIEKIVSKATAAQLPQPFEFEIIPGISSVQVLAARHKIALNRIGGPVHITTGRRLAEHWPDAFSNVVVMLDGQCAFKDVPNRDIHIYWGAYLGTEDEILLSGTLRQVSDEIQRVRAEARARKGWIMDIYLLSSEGPAHA